MRDGHTEVLVGIDRSVVDSNFVVEVRTGGASAEADVADSVAAVDLLSRSDCKTGKVAVAGRDAVAMVHGDELAVSALELREGNYAIRRRDHRVAVSTANIHTAVKCAFPVERVDALTKAGGDLTIDGPEIWCRVGPEPVG